MKHQNLIFSNVVQEQNYPSKIMEDDHYHINDLWEDMDRLNALYEEMMWPNDVELEFKADYENNRIIIKIRE